MLVVYDASGAFVTGGGWIWSPAGAYAYDPSLEGKATFGFVSKYKKGANVPTGSTEFQFKAGDLNFHSDTYDWLVVSGPHAKFKGSGTVNGQYGYGFMITATDGAINGGGGTDKFRIKIWDMADETIVYDNQMDDEDDAEATDEIEGGSIIIHTDKDRTDPSIPTPIGTITGDSGVITATVLDSAEPSQFENLIDFGTDPYDDADFDRLSPGAQEILLDAGTSNSTVLTQAFSYEVLARCEGAVLLKTEFEIAYDDPAGKRADLLVDIAGRKVGVTVTRAVEFPSGSEYTQTAAMGLLLSKLDDVLDSSANVSEEDSWSKQILHILTYSTANADILWQAYDTLAPALRADTIVLITVTQGEDSFLYE